MCHLCLSILGKQLISVSYPAGSRVLPVGRRQCFPFAFACQDGEQMQEQPAWHAFRRPAPSAIRVIPTSHPLQSAEPAALQADPAMTIVRQLSHTRPNSMCMRNNRHEIFTITHCIPVFFRKVIQAPFSVSAPRSPACAAGKAALFLLEEKDKSPHGPIQGMPVRIGMVRYGPGIGTGIA